MIFRGQAYGEPVGEWWTTSAVEAERFAMSRGGNRTYVVLAIDEDPETESWLAERLWARRETDKKDQGCGDWYRIPLDILSKHWRGVKIIAGAISLDPPWSPR